MVDGPVLVGAGGRVFFADYGAADAPTDAVYTNLAGKGWTHAGIISDNGLDFSDERTIVKIMGWREKRPVRKLSADRSTIVTFGMRQWNRENLEFAFGGGSFDGNGTYTPDEDENIPESSLCIAWDDGDDEFLLYFPKGQAGSSIQFNLKKDENITLPIEFEVTSDEDEPVPFSLFTDSQAFASES